MARRYILAILVLIGLLGPSTAVNPIPYPGQAPGQIWLNQAMSYSSFLNTDFSNPGPGLWLIDDSGNWVLQRLCRAGDSANYVMYLPYSGRVTLILSSTDQKIIDEGYMSEGYHIGSLTTTKNLREIAFGLVKLDDRASNVILLVAEVENSNTVTPPGQPIYSQPIISPGQPGIGNGGYSGRPGLGISFPGSSTPGTVTYP